MKKIIGIILAVVLLASGLGGFAYAKSESMKGHKLIGLTCVGTQQGEGWEVTFLSFARIQNADCVGEINIERLSIVRWDGPESDPPTTVVYEGPFLCKADPLSGEPVEMNRPMKPYEFWGFDLASCIPDGEDGWCDRDDVLSDPMTRYTVEICWSAKRMVCSPIGGVVIFKCKTIGNGEMMEGCYNIPMGNREQRL